MSELANEQPPRSDGTVERVMSATGRRTNKLASGINLVFLVGAVVTGLFCAFATAQAPDTSPSFAILTGIVTAVGFLSFGLVVRSIMRGELKHVPDLVRNGVAHPAKIAKHHRDPMGGVHMLTVAWEENGKTATAHFDIAKPDATFAGEIIVLVLPKLRIVGAVLGEDGFFLGKRPLVH